MTAGIQVGEMSGQTATARIQPKKQTLDDAYAPPANFLEIDVINSQTHGVGKKRYTDYEVRMRVCKLIVHCLFSIPNTPPFLDVSAVNESMYSVCDQDRVSAVLQLGNPI